MDETPATAPKDKDKKRKKSSSKKVKDTPIADTEETVVTDEECQNAAAEPEKQNIIEETPTTEYKSAALEKIEEILNPSIRIPQSEGPYQIPEAVQAGDVNALRDLDEKKIIELQEVFTLFDADADGFISESDLRSTFIALGKEPTNDTIDQMLSEAMNPLDFDAFVVLMGYKTIELDPEDVLLEAWSKWDKDGSGTIEEEKCVDQLLIFPHLRETLIQDTSVPEETVCLENLYSFLPPEVQTKQIKISKPAVDSGNSSVETVGRNTSVINDNDQPPPVTRKHFRIRHRQSIFSSERVLGMRVIYEPFRSVGAFSIAGRFQFIDKAMFKNDGNLVPTTYCDYQFLPPPISNEKEHQSEFSWRYFHSPRYPAKYPGHVKCTYKFTGRPRNRVEVLFEEIYLLTGHSSCLQHSDKITIYDGKTPDKSSTIDVFCNEAPSKRVISSGPNLLIEFEASSNRTSNGFSAKYRFFDISRTGQIYKPPSAENLASELLAPSTESYETPASITAAQIVTRESLSTEFPKHPDYSHKFNNASSETKVNSSQHAASGSRGGGGSSVQICPPATALIKVTSTTGTHILRALIDPGSQGSFVTENAVQGLKLKKYDTSVKITGLGTSSVGTSTHQVFFRMESICNKGFSCEVKAYVLKSLTGLHPCEPITAPQSWGYIKNLCLADPTFYTPGKIDVLLGVDVYSQILTNGVRKGDKYSPIAQNSYLGWILFGEIRSGYEYQNVAPSINITNFHNCLESDDMLKRFWELEDIQEAKSITKEERECEDFYNATHQRLPDGRYQVRLPFAGFKPPVLGESRTAAISRLYQIERKRVRTPEIYKEYSSCINEYLELSHMKPANTCECDHVTRNHDEDSGFSVNYLPHHAVFKDSTTTHLRVVFDGSNRTTNGLSLNDTLLVGPKLQEDLTSIVLRWRKHHIVFAADVTKMYRQIKVAESDIPYQRILWRDNPTQPIREYDLTTVTFGTSCAPYLAIRTLRQLAHDEKNNYPLAFPIVLRDFYVDDVMSGADTEDGALEAQEQLRRMLSSGGFELRKWASNNSRLLENIPEEDREKRISMNLSEDGFIKALGIYWHPKNDCFFFKVCIKEKHNTLTKRTLLSQIAQLFDPIGWLTPSIVLAKIMIQELWLAGIAWDDPIPEKIAHKWMKFKTELKLLENIEIPRWIGTRHDTKSIQLHGFCDSSMSAYCAVIYTRIIDGNDNINVNILVSKSKVAPVKPVTLPRLELCGAALLAKLIHKVKSSIDLNNPEIFAWTDSMITLSWIRGRPNYWKTFVCNRVALIQEIVDCKSWRYVNTKDNPADYGSRGCLPSSLIKNSSWWQGPQWLRLPENQWPIQTTLDLLETDHEKKLKVHLAETFQDIAVENFSTISRLIRITAMCFRFIRRLRNFKNKIKDDISTADECRHALHFWIKSVQAMAFSKEISDLKTKKVVHHKSSLLTLFPFLCKDGLVRVGGRLQQSNLNYNEKHPIILPSKHHLTHLIIKQAHLITLHGGPQLMTGFLRRTYWIPHIRSVIRTIVHRCLICFRYKKSLSSQLMGSLPEPRLRISRAFMHTGVDYAGPISMRMSRVKGGKVLKGYIAIFICLCTKAIHLEPVSNLTTDAFLAAFKRFTARRGVCSDVYSDCGTNFVGASKALKNEYEKIVVNIFKESSCKLACQYIRWHFIPPASPHFGGLWEAGVKSLKHHFKRVTGETSLTFEELATLLAEIEACLNSRPLCAMSNDASDLSVLTPAHFLIGDTLLAPPESNVLDMKPHTLTRWRYLQRLKQQMWKRWSREYLSRLQERPKWTNPQTNFKTGNIVLIKDDRLPPTQWLLGRIEEVFPGQDGLVRVVTVRTKGGVLKRPITKIALLPIVDNNI